MEDLSLSSRRLDCAKNAVMGKKEMGIELHYTVNNHLFLLALKLGGR